MDDTQRLVETLRKIEALFEGARTEGEKSAAGLARERIKARLQKEAGEEPLEEFRFSLDNTWSRKLFAAILRRHGIMPFRYYRQRYTTVMIRATPSFVNGILWPQFLAMNEALTRHLDSLAEDIIREIVWTDTSEPEELNALAAGREG